MSGLNRVTLAVALLVSGVAAAQTSTTTTTTASVGSCTGNSSSTSTSTTSSPFAATIAFVARQQSDIDKGNTNYSDIFTTYAPDVFGKAECDCDPSETSQDGIYMAIQISNALPAGTVTNATAWVGTGCTDSTVRNLNTQCKQFFPQDLSGSQFAAGSGHTITSPYYVYVPARLLFNPTNGSCGTNGANSIYIFIGIDQTQPDVTCEVDLSEIAQGASAPVNPRAASGDSAVSVQWDVPTTLNSTSYIEPSYFQVLCADDQGNPINNGNHELYYSTCTTAGLRRRQNIFGESGTTATIGDGGTTLTDDGGTTLALQTNIPAVAAVTDLATTDLAVADMASSITDTRPRPTSYPDLGPFSTLDPKFLCSGAQAVNSSTGSVRVTGLTNNTTYQFVIVAIDGYGNPTPSVLLKATPQPAEDLYGALRSDGSKAHGFCFVATAAFGDYDHPQVRRLRAFRDQVLETSAFGRAFIRTYYRLSPPLAHFIERGDGRRFVARLILWPLVAFAEMAIALHSLVLALAFFVGLAFLVRRARRARLARAPQLEVAA